LPLTVISRVEDSFAILELTGSLTLGPTLSTLRETTRQVLNSNRLSGVILQMAGISVTDSSGLGELTVVYTLTAQRKCPIRLTNVSSNLKKMLEMTRIDELLPTSADVSTAKSEMRRRAAGA